jgi:hypothetical protein
MKMKNMIKSLIAAIGVAFMMTGSVFAANVAKVGNTEYATIDEAIAYANDIIGGNVFAIEFFKGGRNLVGGDLDALELRALPREIPERFLGQGQIKLFDVADAFRVRGWEKGTDLDGRFITDEQGNVSAQVTRKA